MKKFFINLLYPVIVVLAIILVWFVAYKIIGVTLIIPSPLESLKKFISFFKNGDFYLSILNTLLRSFYAFIISFLLAILMAILAYKYLIIRKLLNPLTSIVKAIPTMAIILILIIWLSPNIAPILVAYIVICPLLYNNMLESLDSVDKKVIEMANVYKIKESKKITRIYFPHVLKPTIISVSSLFNLTIKIVIASEAMAQTSKSLGKLMQFSKINLEIEELFALSIVAVILGSFIEFIIKKIGLKFLRWENVSN